MENKITAIGLELEQNHILSALEHLDGIEVEFIRLDVLKDEEKRVDFIHWIKNAKVLMIKDISWDEKADDFLKELTLESSNTYIIPLGSESIGRGIGNIHIDVIEKINKYFIYGGMQNMIHVFHYIRDRYLKGIEKTEVPEPLKMPFDGIFHPESHTVFQSLEDYIQWLKKGTEVLDEVYKESSILNSKGKTKCIGLLIHRSSWVTDNLAVENKLIEEFEKCGVCVIPVFNYGSQDVELEIKSFDEIIGAYFSLNGIPAIDALVNIQLFAMSKDSDSKNVFEHIVEKLEHINIPVFRPLISFTNTIESWKEGMEGLMQEIPWSFTVPEREGMIEPIIIGCRDKKGKAIPIYERIERFVSRVSKWIELKHKDNKDKRLAIFLHNAPCSGVEATIGSGAGLDTFSSVINVLNRLQGEGWSVDNIPNSGNELRQKFMDKKAFSDFRWTSVEKIVEDGGCIYQMPLEGQNAYVAFYSQLEASNRNQMEETWGPPPGEGMVYKDHLIITGLKLGNIVVMIQPKRGCYGAKCTGEVCKILQDPNCPPPHQYLAVYKYVEHIFKADAILHVGTHGSLEFLPGKTNAMSGACFPDAILGNLPNLYIYNAGVGTEAILAKRRTYAVTIGHLPPVYGSGGEDVTELSGLIAGYFEAEYIKSSQIEELKDKLMECIARVKGARAIVEEEDSFDEGLIRLRSVLLQSILKPRGEKYHVFGVKPGLEDILWLIKEIIMSDEKTAFTLIEAFENEIRLHNFLMDFIRQVICGEVSEIHYEILPILEILSDDITEIYSKLEYTENELRNLSLALNSRYVPSGSSGMPDENGRDIIPTGRNLYIMDIKKIPTQAAYNVGCKAAEDLLEKYLADEGKYPEKIGMNMISLDISRSKGEQLSQILYLMGTRPIWGKGGKIIGLEAIPSEILGRPRIDIIVRISGVLRDCYPEIIDMMDEAVAIAANLPEELHPNHIKNNTLQIANLLKKSGITEELKRRSTIRIFGDRPGTYGAGVDLALKASAWEDEEDLARTFIYFSSFAYGKTLKGDPSINEFVENSKEIDVSYDTSNSKRYDLLASNFGASVQGGFGLVGKILGSKSIRQYHGSGEKPGQVNIQSVDEKLKDTIEATLLNPLWKESVKEKGYDGGTQFMQRMQNVFEWQCLTEEVEDKMIDRIVKDYISDADMQQWFKENNPYAAEEGARRFLELHQRGKWNPSPEVLNKLRESYLNFEGDMEEGLGQIMGDMQAGSIEIITDSQVSAWKSKIKDVDEVFGSKKQFK